MLICVSISGSVLATKIRHSPIRIDCNGDFSGIASSGNGTSGNPWMIENLDINGSGYGYCIYVGNTTDYFIIRNCDVYEAYIAIEDDPYLLNAGIHLYNVIHGLVTDNHAYDNTVFGILLYDSSHNDVEDNNVSSNEYGIYLSEGSDNNDIKDNIAYSNTEVAIAVDYSDTNTIECNSVENNGIGYYINDADDNTFKHNVANYNEYGLYIEDSLDNIIINNSFCLSDEYGIYIDSDSDDNSIYHNNIANNTNQAYDSGTDNTWDNGYPSGGNYWSD
ncbi:MAG: right-handed parallel beta-helix repeat-containing protein, partial [Thermoplasmata archaeon]|nr:right-handed parallel beta-helix repeat-containing protein [Thermoplasmata archaeon]